jgi:hypothetical protein
VVNEKDKEPVSVRSLRILRRPNVLSKGVEGFIAELGGALQAIAEATGVERQAEPRRLLDAREYRAAVIAAMTLFETKLRERFNKVPWPDARRPLSMRSLLDQAFEGQIVNRNMREKVDAWMRVRNEVVHSSKAISKALAVEIVNGILSLIATLGL